MSWEFDNKISHLKVHGCGSCPFMDVVENERYDKEEEEVYYVDQYYCKHPKRYLVDLYEDDETGVVTPSDCPLLTESITISIVK